MHQQNSFITLTYSNENLPSDRSIHKSHVQKFIKRLRKNTGKKIRYFACGEYGSKTGRPHYHAIIFGYDFTDNDPTKDRRLWTKTRNGDLLFRSPILEKAWPYGHSTIGNVTFESAAYVARYVMKKWKPDTRSDVSAEDQVKEHYTMVDEETGEIFHVQPEFCLMSRRPGLGATWLEKYKGDTDKDFITLRGIKMSLPTYYDSLLEKMGDNIEQRKAKRMSMIDPLDNTIERNRIKEKVKEAQTNNLNRNLQEFE
jgi:hypothetical protein